MGSGQGEARRGPGPAHCPERSRLEGAQRGGEGRGAEPAWNRRFHGEGRARWSADAAREAARVAHRRVRAVCCSAVMRGSCTAHPGYPSRRGARPPAGAWRGEGAFPGPVPPGTPGPSCGPTAGFVPQTETWFSRRRCGEAADPVLALKTSKSRRIVSEQPWRFKDFLK